MNKRLGDFSLSTLIENISVVTYTTTISIPNSQQFSSKSYLSIITMGWFWADPVEPTPRISAAVAAALPPNHPTGGKPPVSFTALGKLQFLQLNYFSHHVPCTNRLPRPPLSLQPTVLVHMSLQSHPETSPPIAASTPSISCLQTSHKPVLLARR